MSKGSMFWSQATGKVGDIVLSINKGQVITRKYQKNVANPRTKMQMEQRARFASAVAIYKRAYANLFKYAFEDKKLTESDYNAFMRNNVNKGIAILTKAQVDGNFPSISNGWVMSKGSLLQAQVEYDSNAPVLQISGIESATTIGDVSKGIIANYNLVNGDIVTFVVVTSPVTSLTANIPSVAPQYSIVQFRLDTESADALTSVSSSLSVHTRGIKFANAAASFMMATVIFSREVASGLKVSTSVMVGNEVANQIYNDAQSATWISASLATWNVTNNDAVLAGANLDNEVTPTPGPTPPSSNVTLTLVANPTQGGTLTGAGKYTKGQSVQISASANPNYVFTKWSDNDTNATRTIVINEDMTLTATFTAQGDEP